MAEWTSTYDIHEIDALPAGTYVLTEVTAPDGYEVAESVTFEVINSRKIQTVVMKDSSYVLLKGGTGNIVGTMSSYKILPEKEKA